MSVTGGLIAKAPCNKAHLDCYIKSPPLSACDLQIQWRCARRWMLRLLDRHHSICVAVIITGAALAQPRYMDKLGEPCAVFYTML